MNMNTYFCYTGKPLFTAKHYFSLKLGKYEKPSG